MKRHTVMMVENCIAMGLGFDVSDVIICSVSFFLLLFPGVHLIRRCPSWRMKVTGFGSTV